MSVSCVVHTSIHFLFHQPSIKIDSESLVGHCHLHLQFMAMAMATAMHALLGCFSGARLKELTLMCAVLRNGVGVRATPAKIKMVGSIAVMIWKTFSTWSRSCQLAA